MIAFFKRLLQYVLGLFNSPEPEIKKEEPILYYDHTIVFKKAPLIGKVFHEGKKLFRVVYYERYGGKWKCQLELI